MLAQSRSPETIVHIDDGKTSNIVFKQRWQLAYYTVSSIFQITNFVIYSVGGGILLINQLATSLY